MYRYHKTMLLVHCIRMTQSFIFSKLQIITDLTSNILFKGICCMSYYMRYTCQREDNTNELFTVWQGTSILWLVTAIVCIVNDNLTCRDRTKPPHKITVIVRFNSLTERLACLLLQLYYLQWNVFILWFFHWETRMFAITFILLTVECVHSLVRYTGMGYALPE